MTPEQKAREEIDRQLEAAGWKVQNKDELNISAGPGVAVREFSPQVREQRRLSPLRQQPRRWRHRGEARGLHADWRRSPVEKVSRRPCPANFPSTRCRSRSLTSPPERRRSSPARWNPSLEAVRSFRSIDPMNFSGSSGSISSFATGSRNCRRSIPRSSGRFRFGPSKTWSVRSRRTDLGR